MENIVTHPEDPQRKDHENNRTEDHGNSKYSIYNPIRIAKWHGSLEPIDRFTFRITIFTFFLMISSIMQVVSYVETERAYLSIDDISLTLGEPSTDEGGLGFIMIIRNTGKHVAVIRQLNVQPSVFIVKKDLPEYPTYLEKQNIKTVIPPIAPQEQRFARLDHGKQEFGIPTEDVVKGAKNGAIPLRVFGFIDYDTGYWFPHGRIGYCFVYIPESKRSPILVQRFAACDNPNYTYTN
jgi:hypothetical protein